MQRYEYKVVPAPRKGTKAKGVKTPEGRFAVTIEQLLNDLAIDGWEYHRSELLPSEERSGLTGSTLNWRNVMVFRRMANSEAANEDMAAFLSPPEEDATPLARAVPGPRDVEAPKPIPAEPDEPPVKSENKDD